MERATNRFRAVVARSARRALDTWRERVAFRKHVARAAAQLTPEQLAAAAQAALAEPARVAARKLVAYGWRGNRRVGGFVAVDGRGNPRAGRELAKARDNHDRCRSLREAEVDDLRARFRHAEAHAADLAKACESRARRMPDSSRN